MQNKKNNKQGFMQILGWVKAVGAALILALLIHNFVAIPIVVKGVSMMPTLQGGDRLIANKIGYTINGVERLDIIVFHATGEQDYIKRVVGLPGDHIEYKDDQLYINGEEYEEEYLDEYKNQLIDDNPFTYDFELETLTGSVVVPEGHYFVLGDNRRDSKDSRTIGFVSVEDVIGKASVIYWPLEEIGIL